MQLNLPSMTEILIFIGIVFIIGLGLGGLIF